MGIISIRRLYLLLHSSNRPNNKLEISLLLTKETIQILAFNQPTIPHHHTPAEANPRIPTYLLHITLALFTSALFNSPASLFSLPRYVALKSAHFTTTLSPPGLGLTSASQLRSLCSLSPAPGGRTSSFNTSVYVFLLLCRCKAGGRARGRTKPCLGTRSLRRRASRCRGGRRRSRWGIEEGPWHRWSGGGMSRSRRGRGRRRRSSLGGARVCGGDGRG